MKRPNTTAVARGVVIALVGFWMVFSSPSPVKSSKLIGLQAEALQQPNAPVQLKDLVPISNIVTKETAVHYTVSNPGPGRLQEIELWLLVFDESGKARGGQMSTEHLDLLPGEESRRELKLSNLLYSRPTGPRRRFVVAVEAVRTDELAWRLGGKFADLVSAMREGITFKGEPALSPASPQTGCASDLCDKCEERSIRVSGGGNVASYTCTIGASCTCSFECGPGTIEP